MTEQAHRKIVDLDEMARITSEARSDGRSVVLCHGVFDLLHIGHMRYFEGARAHGDLLIVTVTPDRYVDKGAFRPAFPDDLRLEAIAALSAVDYVALNAWPTAEETLRTLRPDVYAKGAEFRQVGADATGKMEVERAVAAEVGCRVEFVDDVVFSSSQLINLHLHSYPVEVADYLADLRGRWSASDASDLLERMAKLSVLVVGSTVDETTIEVECLGLDGQDASPKLRTLRESRRSAGAPALARHLRSLAGSVELLTLGSREELAADLPDVTLHCRTPSAGTQTRRRFVDVADGRVWFTSLTGSGFPADDGDAESADRAWIADQLTELSTKHDAVIVVDQGPNLLAIDSIDGLEGIHVSHLPDDGPVFPKIDLALWLGDLPSTPPSASDGRSLGSLARSGEARLRREDVEVEAPSFVSVGPPRLGWEAFAAVLCLADAVDADPELTLFVAQAAGLLASSGGSGGEASETSRRRLLKQLTSMLK
ncbi:MAG: adenylyltransferase/cytidyltransferase family protein [Thermoanaerobaculia bacterium]|nr:adenylyltransferase/cytidyltransferase family protein [Thermoanaerobaculia bacterium]